MTNHRAESICSECGKTFAPRSNFARKCDACCAFTCAWCGKSYTSRRGRPSRFCSLECTNAWQNTPQAKAAGRERTIQTRGRGKVLRCKTCGESFYAPGWRLDKSTPKYCARACRDYHEDMKGINRVLRFPHRPAPNGLESAGAAILDGLGIAYTTQQVIGGKFIVDALIADAGIIIQWDGDFWHANPAVYPVPAHAIQAANVKRDRACNVYLTKCGYTVLRFWESDVHSCLSWVAAEISRALASSAST